MNKLELFDKWWQENHHFLSKSKEMLEAGDYYVAQQAFLAGMLEYEEMKGDK